ncbi:MAG: thioredoxin family protein [Patescibacteria group bacterium]
MKSVQLQILKTPGCQICHRFLSFWETHKAEFSNITTEVLDIVESEKAQELVQKFQIFSSPGIIINGELFSTGGYDETSFLTRLKELS